MGKKNKLAAEQEVKENEIVELKDKDLETITAGISMEELKARENPEVRRRVEEARAKALAKTFL